ncbi:pyrimidine dimer DNA glycosylase/endonuclease V [Halalkalibacillus halophilus]|uniref:pyrimidine dimer DNA glycosylase/endonuclease V n=1 Tax=Halalkalibacillus halophilus TaxID=392827 RepID=UPI0003F99049|nr:pyrimidine dimer DNA glycosylase/endonuclease V [Halalkalibacillus halophilus]
MRIWSVHPTYLDAKGLVALWRETLLAQKVLQGNTKGYKNHPQLERFKKQEDPLSSIGAYLTSVYEEANARGYKFDASKIVSTKVVEVVPVTTGQMQFEWEHLLMKLATRDPVRLEELQLLEQQSVQCHPLFHVIDGDIENWEKV